jgi:hypothetical protein
MRVGMVRRCQRCIAILLTGSTLAFAEPFQQSPSTEQHGQSIEVLTENAGKGQASPNADGANSETAPVIDQLPDAPTPAQPVQQSPNESSSVQQNQNEVPSGAAAAKAPVVRGAPASRTVGAAIAPAKQRQRRSLLIKAGLLAGACIAVGSAFALAKGSPSKPPGAP